MHTNPVDNYAALAQFQRTIFHICVISIFSDTLYKETLHIPGALPVSFQSNYKVDPILGATIPYFFPKAQYNILLMRTNAFMAY